MDLHYQAIFAMGFASLVGSIILGEEGFGLLSVVIHDLKEILKQRGVSASNKGGLELR